MFQISSKKPGQQSTMVSEVGSVIESGMWQSDIAGGPGEAMAAPEKHEEGQNSPKG